MKKIMFVCFLIAAIFICFTTCENQIIRTWWEEKNTNGKDTAFPVIIVHPEGAFYSVNTPAKTMTVIASIKDGSPLSYQWYSNNTNSNVEGDIIHGATGTGYTPPTDHTGLTYYYVVVSNTITKNGDEQKVTADAVSHTAIIGVNVSGGNNGGNGGGNTGGNGGGNSGGNGGSGFIDMIPVPDGTFIMGSPGGEPDRDNNEGPQHQVTLSGFYMGKYLVTQEQFEIVMGYNPSFFNAVAGESGTPEKQPVENTNWYEALVFCNKLSMLEGLSPAYRINNSTDPAKWGTTPTSITDPNKPIWDAVEIVPGSNGYRLPTEAQWEYACRAGTTTIYNTGDVFSDNIAWYKDNSGYSTHKVGLKTPNAWGFYDMHGNLREYCWDWLGAYSSKPQTNPMGPSSGTDRTARGGSFDDKPQNLRSATRFYCWTYAKKVYFGFRVVLP